MVSSSAREGMGGGVSLSNRTVAGKLQALPNLVPGRICGHAILHVRHQMQGAHAGSVSSLKPAVDSPCKQRCIAASFAGAVAFRMSGSTRSAAVPRRCVGWQHRSGPPSAPKAGAAPHGLRFRFAGGYSRICLRLHCAGSRDRQALVHHEDPASAYRMHSPKRPRLQEHNQDCGAGPAHAALGCMNPLEWPAASMGAEARNGSELPFGFVRRALPKLAKFNAVTCGVPTAGRFPGAPPVPAASGGSNGETG